MPSLQGSSKRKPQRMPTRRLRANSSKRRKPRPPRRHDPSSGRPATATAGESRAMEASWCHQPALPSAARICAAHQCARCRAQRRHRTRRRRWVHRRVQCASQGKDCSPCHLPDNCTPGQVISVRVPGTNETVQVTVPNNATPGSTLQFEVSPSRVPEPVQAVGFENSLGAAAEIYGGGMGVGAAPAQPTRRRRASSGVSPPLSLTVSVFGFFFSPKSRLPAFLLSLVYHYSLSSDSMHTLCKCTW